MRNLSWAFYVRFANVIKIWLKCPRIYVYIMNPLTEQLPKWRVIKHPKATSKRDKTRGLKTLIIVIWIGTEEACQPVGGMLRPGGRCAPGERRCPGGSAACSALPGWGGARQPPVMRRSDRMAGPRHAPRPRGSALHALKGQLMRRWLKSENEPISLRTWLKSR